MYERKTIDRWDIETNYGYGWEVECSEYTRTEAKRTYREYRDNVQAYGKGLVRLTKHREKIVKEYYSLVVAVLDEDGNRVDSEEIVGSNNVETIRSNRKELDNEIANGKYDRLKRDKYILISEIEVHDNDTYELLYVIL